MDASDNVNTAPMHDGKRLTPDSICLDIDKVLSDEELRSATLHEAAGDWAVKLEALHDIEALLAFRVQRKEISFAESVECLDDFISFLSGD